MGLSNATVGKWRKRYRERGLAGLHDELRPGRARTYDDERVAEVINAALQTKPADRTQWSVRSMAEHSGVSKSTVQRDRISDSKNLILFLSSITKNSTALREEIDYGINTKAQAFLLLSFIRNTVRNGT